MGLREEIQTEIGLAFDEDLADAAVNITLTQNSRDGYDTSSGKTTPVTTNDYDSRAVFGEYSDLEIFNSSIEPTDSKVLILANELEVAPRIGDLITRETDSRVFRIIAVAQDPAGVAHVCQARSTKR